MPNRVAAVRRLLPGQQPQYPVVIDWSSAFFSGFDGYHTIVIGSNRQISTTQTITQSGLKSAPHRGALATEVYTNTSGSNYLRFGSNVLGDGNYVVFFVGSSNIAPTGDNRALIAADSNSDSVRMFQFRTDASGEINGIAFNDSAGNFQATTSGLSLVQYERFAAAMLVSGANVVVLARSLSNGRIFRDTATITGTPANAIDPAMLVAARSTFKDYSSIVEAHDLNVELAGYLEGTFTEPAVRQFIDDPYQNPETLRSVGCNSSDRRGATAGPIARQLHEFPAPLFTDCDGGMKTIIPVRLQDCSWGEFERDGKTYKVEGECDTARCGAVCCKVMNWRGRVGERCQYLLDDMRCEFHAADVHCKPISCWLWPTKTRDIEKTNEIAERLGFKERCHLKVVEVPDGNS